MHMTGRFSCLKTWFKERLRMPDTVGVISDGDHEGAR
jgi:hypothetical protein